MKALSMIISRMGTTLLLQMIGAVLGEQMIVIHSTIKSEALYALYSLVL